MTIDKAIETITELREYPKPGFNGEDTLAIELGIEALRLVKRYKELKIGFYADLLPGETEE